MGFGAPGFLDLGEQEVPYDLMFKAVIDRPEDTELLVSGDQLQNRPETYGGVKILRSTPLLPGVDGEQLQSILGGQRPLCLQFPFTLKKDGVGQMMLVTEGRHDKFGRATETALRDPWGQRVPECRAGGADCSGEAWAVQVCGPSLSSPQAAHTAFFVATRPHVAS